MEGFRLTIKNYRCFDRSTPLVFDMQEGFTGFVGPNNAGKSALLRLFFECRPLWQALRTPQQVLGAMQSGGLDRELQGVGDALEVFALRNDGDLSVSLAFSGASTTTPSCTGVTLTQRRGARGRWQLELTWKGDAPQPRDLAIHASDPANIRMSNSHAVDVRALTDAMAILADAMYIGPFRNALSHPGDTYFDLTAGAAFIITWDQWKTGRDRRHNQLATAAEADVRRIFGFSSFQVNATPDKRDLQVVVDDRSVRIGELGAGLAQFVIVLGSAAVRQPSLLLVDEPEANLHPTLQRDFLLSLARYAKHGVMFGTHSIGLARSVADRLFSVRGTANGSELRRFSATSNFAEFVGEMGFGAYHDLGFDRLLLVEGVTEVKTIQQLLRLYAKEHQVVLLPLGGGQMINQNTAHELEELARISSRVSVLIDSERQGPGDPLAQDRQAFVATCQGLGFEAHATERRATENYFTDVAVKAEFGAKHSALGPFDDPKRITWGKANNWRVAGHMKKADVDATDLGAFFTRL